MRFFSALALAITTVVTIAVMWVRAKWATSIPEIAMCVPAAVWGAMLLAGKQNVRRAWVMIPLGAVVFLGSLQVLFGVTVYSWPTRMASLYWAGNLATFFVALQVFADREWRVRYTAGLVIFGVSLAVFSTIHAMTSPESTIYWTFQDPLVDARLFGPFLYVNQYAAFIELVFPLAMYAALTKPHGRLLYTLAAATLAGSVLFGGSRGGAALLGLETVSVLLLVGHRTGTTRRQMTNTAVILAVGVLWVLVLAKPDMLITKFNRTDWYSSRRDFNTSSLEMIKARPLQGFGLGNWATAYPGYASFDDGTHANQAHNDWLQWTVEGGIPMLLLMLAVAVWAVPRAIRSVWGIGVAIIFIHCLWDYPIQRTGVAIVFFTMMAAIAPYGRPLPAPDNPFGDAA